MKIEIEFNSGDSVTLFGSRVLDITNGILTFECPEDDTTTIGMKDVSKIVIT